MGAPSLVVVSGPAGSGKTTLAHTLGVRVGCPVVCRDEIKEGLVHALGSDFEAEPGDWLTRRAFEIFCGTLRALLEAGVTVVGEAAFHNQVWMAVLEPLRGISSLRIVRCQADAVAARRRVAGRSARSAHADSYLLADPAYYDSFAPVSLPVPTLDVDTTEGYQPALAHVVAFARGVEQGPPG